MQSMIHSLSEIVLQMLMKLREKEKTVALKEEEIRKMHERLEKLKLEVRKYVRWYDRKGSSAQISRTGRLKRRWNESNERSRDLKWKRKSC